MSTAKTDQYHAANGTDRRRKDGGRGGGVGGRLTGRCYDYGSGSDALWTWIGIESVSGNETWSHTRQEKIRREHSHSVKDALIQND